ncbi:hypothetical protein TWF106_006918 [Orbilia oligospora]|uniref:NADP-dependent oxidoreductase domain-containing protein n=1 Tax=Orbilia oligospora TaxID=2813651 RepID=A0A6G1M3Q5_ORBOL|nr:hypothetical protein TWF788_005414 [Orbilia oligospora]KAF3209450.1 hypothetical protein TWF191_000363 [Orbilia oligospora]KAF3219764.1 hypothetical protein TWF106_006918 [Orbilia oligospora]KAF3221402.1 hypothetical protein TWF679_008089 [Orbilia oligospora]KAF3242588.1 hypothetical protein TWF192_008592 [Orbilia oligospora]
MLLFPARLNFRAPRSFKLPTTRLLFQTTVRVHIQPQIVDINRPRFYTIAAKMSDGQWTSLSYTLNTGDKIPAVGLGTWQSKPGEVRNAVAAALRAGYRHIDTALAYGNEREVGLGIKDSGVPREEIWITTKLDNTWHKHVKEGLASSLNSLGVEYIDLYLMHWPCSTAPSEEGNPASAPADPPVAYTDVDYLDAWAELEKLPKSQVRNVGVSNFDITQLNRLLRHAKVTPAVNQIELHPNNPTHSLTKFCAEKGIHVTGYSILGSTNSPLVKDQTLAGIAQKHGRSIQQVLLAWGLQHGYSVIPKSVTESRIVSNFQVDGLVLTEDDLKALDTLKDRFKVCGDDWLPHKIFLDRPE